jgi:hypothetical protein
MFEAIICLPTVALWLVAEFEALSYQGTPNFNKSENLETGTATAINYSACCMPQLFINHYVIKSFLSVSNIFI